MDVSERKTIRLGDEADDWTIEVAPVVEAVERADQGNEVPNAVLTGRGPAADRTTIAIGGDDVLPDAVYLDGDFDGGDPGTVFIDDDGTGDAIGVKDATTPGIEPRLRERRIGVNRAANRKRIKWVGLIAIGAFILLGVLTVLGSSWFAINDVDVTGAVYTDENRLELVVDELLGTAALLADTKQAEEELESIPWVQNARVRVDFPNAAMIEIRERTPVATMAGIDGRFRVLDNEGRVLDVIEGQPVAFVLIGGPSTLDLAAGEFAPVGQASAASLVTKLTPSLRPHVLSIDVTDDGSDLVLYLEPNGWSEQTSPIRVRFGSAIGDGDQIDKLVRLEAQLSDLPVDSITEINVATKEVTVL
jgi:cell division protein FtsQ